MIYQNPARVLSNEALLGGYARLTFEDQEIAKDCRPGQFLSVRTSDYGIPLLRRPFGVHDVDGDAVTMLVKVIGPGTEQFAGFTSGQTIDVLGPLGTGFDLDAIDGPVLLVAGGIGIAPLFYTARVLMQSGHAPTLLFGGATKNDLPTLDLFEALGVPVQTVTEDGSHGEKGLVTTPLQKFMAKAPSLVLSCGPPAMLKAVSDIAHKYNAPCQVSLESVMACGVGSCLGCVTEVIECGDSDDLCYERVCREGPVFDSRKVAWKKGAH
jgi:dihydroorotate dehydrogenase electron transfer subunit